MARDEVKLSEGDVTLRSWTAADAEALVKIGDDRDIWLNLRDRFPHPFTLPAAQLWLSDQSPAKGPATSFAVVHGGQLAGGVKLIRREDAHRMCADVTFWLGRAFWGKKIAPVAVRLATTYAFDELGLARVQAFVFDWNPRGTKVVEHAGFTFEGRLRGYVQKGDRLGDALLYARLQGDPAPKG